MSEYRFYKTCAFDTSASHTTADAFAIMLILIALLLMWWKNKPEWATNAAVSPTREFIKIDCGYCEFNDEDHGKSVLNVFKTLK